MAEKKCRNTGCEWHDKGGCRLFPGDWGFLECQHSQETNEQPRQVRKTNKKQKGK